MDPQPDMARATAGLDLGSGELVSIVVDGDRDSEIAQALAGGARPLARDVAAGLLEVGALSPSACRLARVLGGEDGATLLLDMCHPDAPASELAALALEAANLAPGRLLIDFIIGWGRSGGTNQLQPWLAEPALAGPILDSVASALASDARRGVAPLKLDAETRHLLSWLRCSEPDARYLLEVDRPPRWRPLRSSMCSASRISTDLRRRAAVDLILARIGPDSARSLVSS